MRNNGKILKDAMDNSINSLAKAQKGLFVSTPQPVYDNIPSPGMMMQKALLNNGTGNTASSRLAAAVDQQKKDAQIVADRKKRMAASIEARKRPFSAQQLADETQAIGDKFRLFPNDAHSFIDDYLNPGVLIGNLATNMGRVPLNIQQGNYGQAALDVATPALLGATEVLAAPYINKGLSNANTQIARRFGVNIGEELQKAGKRVVDETKFGLKRNIRRITPGYIDRKNISINKGNQWTHDWYSDPLSQERYNNWVEKPSLVYTPKGALEQSNFDIIVPVADPKMTTKLHATVARDNMENFLRSGKATKGTTDRFTFGDNNVLGRYSYRSNNALVDVLHPSLGAKGKGFNTANTTVHENIHYLTRGNEGLTTNAQKFLQRPFDVDPVTNLPARSNFDVATNTIDYDKYLSNPTEVHARLGELRRTFGLKPNQQVDYPLMNRIMDEGLKGNTSVDKRWFELVNDKSALKWLFNNAPVAVPAVAGATALTDKKKKGGPIVDPRGQWAHPGKDTIIPTVNGMITMKDVNYPVHGQDETGYTQMMYPGGEYVFPGNMIYETPMLGKGGIHINPANRGKFTASAKRAGMGVQEFASHVLSNKEDYSSTQVKRANFAKNASRWKHQFGGITKGTEMEVTPEQVEMLRKQGYQFEII